MKQLAGYVWSESEDETLHEQKTTLISAGCKRIFTDVSGGSSIKRTGLNRAIKFLDEGDCLVICQLNYLANSVKQLIEVIHSLQVRKIDFCSLQENLDTITINGALISHVFQVLVNAQRR